MSSVTHEFLACGRLCILDEWMGKERNKKGMSDMLIEQLAFLTGMVMEGLG